MEEWRADHGQPHTAEHMLFVQDGKRVLRFAPAHWLLLSPPATTEERGAICMEMRRSMWCRRETTVRGGRLSRGRNKVSGRHFSKLAEQLCRAVILPISTSRLTTCFLSLFSFSFIKAVCRIPVSSILQIKFLLNQSCVRNKTHTNSTCPE